MALANKDPHDIKEQLHAWLRARLPGADDVRIDELEVPQGSGMSNLTILVDASWSQDGEQRNEQLVARVAPDGPGAFIRYDLAKEFRVMSALADHTTVPVPRMRWHEPDTSVLGAEFLVMDRAGGRVPSDDPPFTVEGWVVDLIPAQRRELHENGLRALAAIHACDWRTLGLDFLAPAGGGDPFDAELALWHEVYDWARQGERNPTVDAGFAWLAEHRPARRADPVLLWGDPRVGNMLFGDDLAVKAVLDWEFVRLGAPDADVAWWIFLQRHHTEGLGVPLPEGIPTREETIAAYERIAGRPVPDVGYYEVWAGVQLSILMHRAGNLMIEVGLIGPDATMKLNNPASQLLARLIGVQPPAGDAQSFIGNR